MKLVKFAAICAAAVSVSAIAEDVPVSNTLAILPVAKTLNAMPLTVNFTAADGSALSAANIVKTAGLPSGSALYVYDKVNSKYTKYVLSGNAWALANDGKTYTINASGQLVEGQGDQAEANPVAPGAAVFLETPAGSATFYVAGTPATGATTTVSAGANLIGAPTAAAFDLNSNTATWPAIKPTTFTGNTDKDKVVEIGDTIQVPSSDGGLSDVYYYRAKEDNLWGCWGKFVRSGRSSTFVTTDCIIPAGRGFWYLRADSNSMTITW